MAVEVKNIMTLLPKHKKNNYYGRRKIFAATIYQYPVCLYKVLKEPVVATAVGIDKG